MSVPQPIAAELQAALEAFDPRAFEPNALSRAADEWARRAQAEHASIASFDRFSLGLMAVGAPPELLLLSHQAALDEIVHARISFAIASAYGGCPVGPGPLDFGGPLEVMATLAELVDSTIVEGCVGETLSALEAREAATVAREPAASSALARIADDEARHAELAWAFVRWALGVDPGLKRAVEQCFEHALERVLGAPLQARCFDPELNAFGLLTEEQTRALRQRAVREVLEPAAKSLARS